MNPKKKHINGRMTLNVNWCLIIKDTTIYETTNEKY